MLLVITSGNAPRSFPFIFMTYSALYFTSLAYVGVSNFGLTFSIVRRRRGMIVLLLGFIFVVVVFMFASHFESKRHSIPWDVTLVC